MDGTIDALESAIRGGARLIEMQGAEPGDG